MKKITPLTEFPTEAILMLFKKKRQCRTNIPYNARRHYDKKRRKWQWWLPFYGEWTDDEGNYYNPITIGFTLYDELPKEYTTTYGNHGTWNCFDDWYSPSEEIDFRFEGMYWSGKVKDVREELAKRPHCNIHSAKDFRKWKIEYKKSLKR